MKCPHNCPLEHTSVDIDDVDVKIPPKIRTRPCVIECAHYRVSASGKGFHVAFCVRAPKQDIAAQLFGLRMFNLDDPARMYYDLWRFLKTDDLRYARGALFDLKNGKKASRWRNLAWGQ